MTTTSGTLLALPGGWEQAPVLARAIERFDRVVVCDLSETPAGLPSGAEHRRVDSVDLAGIASVIAEISPTALLADQCDYSTYTAALFGAQLGLPAANLRAAALGVDKVAARQTYAAAGIPQPEFGFARSLDEAQQVLTKVGYPAVVKPPDNRGCFGVRIVKTPDELHEAFFEALQNSRYRCVILESMIEGTHVTVDGYHFPEAGHRTLAIASKDVFEGERPIIRRVTYPADIPASHRQRLLETHEAAVAALGVDFGPTHGEYIIEADGTPRILEVATRGGGVLTFPVILPAHTGLDLVGRQLDDAAGLPAVLNAPPESLPTPVASVVLDFFGLPGKGIVKRFTGLQAASQVSGVHALRTMVAPGEELLPPVNGARRHGFCIASGSDSDVAQAVAERAAFEIDTEFEERTS